MTRLIEEADAMAVGADNGFCPPKRTVPGSDEMAREGEGERMAA